MAAISCSVLDTDRVPARDRFDLWRDALSATHQATLPHDSDSAGFSAFARGWNLGPSLVFETRASAQRLARDPRAVRADQIDHYIIRLQRRGIWKGDADGRAVEVDAGGVIVLDMARPTVALGTDIDNVNLLVPRDMLDAVLAPFDLHGLVLQGAMAELLRSHLVMLTASLPQIPLAAAHGIGRATCGLVAACLAPSRDALARAKAPLELARFALIRRYIERHLASPELSPETICKALGLSRSTLYAACEPLGGVAALIRRRRLDRIRAILTDPRDPRRISEIAYQHGFVSRAHFSRAFRDAFGHSASDVREGALREAGNPSGTDAYEIWMRQLRG
jgi:AraC-like DNA-binding protein